MTRRPLLRTLLLPLAALFLMGARPAGWSLVGSASHAYRLSLDRDTVHSGRQSARLASTQTPTEGFGSLMQSIEADRYRGERVRLSGWLRGEEIEGWAGLWMRVDDRGGVTLSFDNMQDRPVRGDLNWTQVSVVLEVPETAAAISFGALLSGAGTLWVDDVALEKVGRDVPLTDQLQQQRAGPQNLDFE